MNAELFAEWLERQGHRVQRTGSSYWVEQASRVYQALPYNYIIRPSEAEFAALWRAGALAIRYSTPLEEPVGRLSYHVFCSRDAWKDRQLSKKARHDIRRGLEYAKVQPIPWTQLAEEGWRLRAETLQRQGRQEAETAHWWRRMCLAAGGVAGFEAWGAIESGRLVACILAALVDSSYCVLYQQSSTADLKHSVNNALAFQVTEEAFSRLDVSEVFYGLHSLDAPPSVDQFKFRMGFSAKPLRQRIVVNSLVAPLFNRVTYRFLKQLHDRRPQNSFLAKAEGVFRFYLEGKLPLESQVPPEGLVFEA